MAFFLSKPVFISAGGHKGRPLYWILTSPNLWMCHPYPCFLQLFLPVETLGRCSEEGLISAFWPPALCYPPCKAVSWLSYRVSSLTPITRACNALWESQTVTLWSKLMWVLGRWSEIDTVHWSTDMSPLSRCWMAQPFWASLLWPSNLRIPHNCRVLCHLSETQSIFQHSGCP